MKGSQSVTFLNIKQKAIQKTNQKRKFSNTPQHDTWLHNNMTCANVLSLHVSTYFISYFV